MYCRNVHLNLDDEKIYRVINTPPENKKETTDEDDTTNDDKKNNGNHDGKVAEGQEFSFRYVIWVILLCLVAGFLLYITLLRFGLAGKFAMQGKPLLASALMSPELATVAQLVLLS
uniref:Uncharacterized protein n=1 Tax=viral metagenome TaxID=1070528 RepID=A0A6C0EDE7_9ZZZZ